MPASRRSRPTDRARRSCAARPEGAEYFFFGDEHGRVELADAPRHLPVGSVLECLTPHCDPTVNLYNAYHVIQGDTLVDIWPIDARGAI